MKNRALPIFAGVVALALVVFFLTRPGAKQNRSDSATANDSTEHAQGGAGEANRDKAQPRASLQGQVLAADGTSLGGATVALVARGDDDAPLEAHEAVLGTKADGSYAYGHLPAGDYTISANAPGFLPQQLTVQLAPGEARNGFNLQLQPGGFLVSGTVHDATGGTIPGAIVQALPLSTNTSESSGALSGPEGTYQLGLANGRYMVWAYHGDYVPHSQLVEVSGGPLTVDFRLAPGAIVEGVVKHLGTNEPQPGATVTYATERVNSFSLWAGSSGAGVTTADEQGRFRITGLGSGSLRLTARGDNTTSGEPTRIALGIAEHRSDIELFVDSAFRVSGRVVDAATGEGIGSMHVTLEAPRGEGSANFATSDETGAFEIVSVAAGEYRVRAQGYRYLIDMFGTPVVVESDTDVGLIKLKRGAVIEGRVEPASEAEVSVDLRSVNRIQPGTLVQAHTRADGTFEIGPFPPSNFRLQASTNDGRVGSTNVDVPSQGVRDVVITLSPSGSFEGTVVDANGEPVGDAQVSLRQDMGNRALHVMVNGLDRMARSGRTSPDGHFLVSGLTAGDYLLHVLDLQGQPLSWSRVGKRESATAPRKLSMGASETRTGEVLKVEARTASIRGRVLGPDGHAAADTWVSASLARHDDLRGMMPGPGSAPSPGDDEDEKTEERSEVSMIMISDDGGNGNAPGLDLSRSGELPPVLTDADGNFEITGLRDGEYDLVAEGMRGAARAIVQSVKTGNEVEIKMAVLTRIEGTVTMDGTPVPRFTVELSGTGHQRKQVRDEQGHFVLHRMDPGHYTVTVRGAHGEAEADVTVEAGKAATVAIALEQLVDVSGTIINKQGTPVAGLLTIPTPKRDDGNTQLMIGDDMTPTGPDGRFELRVKPGDYMLLILRMGEPPVATMPFKATKGSDVDLGKIVAKPDDRERGEEGDDDGADDEFDE